MGRYVTKVFAVVWQNQWEDCMKKFFVFQQFESVGFWGTLFFFEKSWSFVTGFYEFSWLAPANVFRTVWWRFEVCTTLRRTFLQNFWKKHCFFTTDPYNNIPLMVEAKWSVKTSPKKKSETKQLQSVKIWVELLIKSISQWTVSKSLSSKIRVQEIRLLGFFASKN